MNIIDPESNAITETLGLQSKIVSQMINEENFRKLSLGMLKLYESNNWIFINKVYVPKNFISHMYVYNTGSIKSMRVYLVNGAYIIMHHSALYEKTIKRMCPSAFIVISDRMNLLVDTYDRLATELKNYNITMEDVILERPAFFDDFAKENVKLSEEAFEETLKGKSKLAKFFLKKLS
ncbi:hypothetical protein [uncultured Clostridium sp.]|jgi:replicative superfamily II helicase|uniref:hypothetical protein n=1 Tax=uncultured Clostridium sp. TaxID=59620 RepID=UPI00261DC4B2|nr:hypothetical protein [uncultured Clostridium sp.]